MIGGDKLINRNTVKLTGRISLRTRLIGYILVLHLIFASLSIYLLIGNRSWRIWLIALEAAFVISFYTGLKLVRAIFGTLELISTGAEFMHDNDFTSRFREVGHPEMDKLVGIYNRMIDNLRDERTRLQEQNFFMEKIMQGSPSGILTLDFDRRISTANPAALQILQIEADYLIGRRLSEIDRPITAALEELIIGESRIISTAGSRRLRCFRSSFLDRGFSRDFYLIEELTEELRQAEKNAYEKVIRLMSHEVNNSIGSANSLLHSSLHYSAQLNPEDRKDFEMAMNVVINRTDHLNQFMKNFADVFRLPPPDLQPRNLKDLVQETAWLFKSDFENRRIKIEMEWKQCDPIVRLDRNQFGQALVNIVKNAIEAIGENGTISIRMGELSNRRYLIIEDTGSGIPQKVRENLFTPFFSTREKGQGIGLTLVQEILDQHGFEFSLISLQNEPTRFTIYFDK